MRALGLILLMAYIALSCASTHDSSKLKAPQTNLYTDFCKLKGIQTDPTVPQLWSSESVQFHLRKLISQPSIANSPWVSYPVAYLKMTAARDEARCSGVLRGVGFHARVNDLLSDLMSRFYIEQIEKCAASGAALGQEAGFCPLMGRMQTDRFDSLSSAMASTGVYVSSHITVALIAIIFDDNFWQATPYPETYRKSAPWNRVVNARLEKMRGYKPLFDKFNGFLADNIKTVAEALGDARLIKGNVLNLLAGMSQYVPFKSLAFGKIRDDAFDLAMELAREIEPADHPMLAASPDWNQIAFGHYNFNFIYPEKLLRLENEGIKFSANPAFMLMYRGVLGGKSWEEVLRN